MSMKVVGGRGYAAPHRDNSTALQEQTSRGKQDKGQQYASLGNEKASEELYYNQHQ
jgi:hypothetical protein